MLRYITFPTKVVRVAPYYYYYYLVLACLLLRVVVYRWRNVWILLKNTTSLFI